MNKKISIGAALAAAALAVAVTFVVTVNVMTARFNDQLKGVQSQKNQYEKLSEISALVSENAYYKLPDDIRDESLAASYAQALRDAGDDYARYYTREEFEKISSERNGGGSGVGIRVMDDENGLFVHRVLRGSPAFSAGILAGDVITAVADENGAVLAQSGDGYDAFYSALSKDIGTTLSLTLTRTVKTVDPSAETDADGGTEDGGTEDGGTEDGGTEDGGTEDAPPVVTVSFETVDVSVTLADFSNETVWMERYGSVAVVTVSEFNYDTDEAFTAIIDSIERDVEITGVIFDLRANGGGQLSTVVNMLDRLLPEGVIVTETNAAGKETARYTSDAVSFSKKMAVLVNGTTASASELFSCALRDYGKAQLVGSPTYGKGCVQTTYVLSDGGAMVFTTAMYNPPSSGNYDGKPLQPDILVELSERQEKYIFSLDRKDDPQFTAALPLVTVRTENANNGQ